MNQNYNYRYILVISFISALGGYLFGFDFAVISGALPFLKTEFNLDALQEGFTTASLAIGCIAGCVSAGKISEKKGRRFALKIAAFVFMVSSISMALSNSLVYFNISRFFAGTAVGMASVLSPMYIAEISPPDVRGRMVSLNQFAIVTGILFTNVINYFLGAGGNDSWRWMFASGAVPSVLFFAGILLLPESPHWLVNNGQPDKAKKVLNKIGNTAYAEHAFQQLHKPVTRSDKTPFSIIFRPQFVKPVIAGAGLAILQQFCGINVVFNYNTTIFESLGLNKSDQLMQTVFTGAVNMAFTFVAMALVDKIGRKPLMLVGTWGLAILYIFIAQALHAGSMYSAVFLLAAIAVYAATIAPVTWVLISELFPGDIREQATSFSVVCLWGAYFVLTLTFPLLAEVMGDISNTFYIYAAVCVGFALFVRYKIAETKGVALGEMNNLFRH
jgi:sugar porter (SP) family MFS transporter